MESVYFKPFPRFSNFLYEFVYCRLIECDVQHFFPIRNEPETVFNRTGFCGAGGCGYDKVLSPVCDLFENILLIF